jgi:hypothetical protein
MVEILRPLYPLWLKITQFSTKKDKKPTQNESNSKPKEKEK